MGQIETALRFSEGAVAIMVLGPYWFVFALVVVSLVWAGLKQRPFQTRLWRPSHWLVLSHLLFFAAAIALGTLCPYPTTNPTIPHYPNRPAALCLAALLYGSLASCAFWVWRMKGFRWFGSSLMALIEMPTVGALFVASMSVTGDWL